MAKDDWGHRDLGDYGARLASVKATRLESALREAHHWSEVVQSAAASSLNGWHLYAGDVLACLCRLRRELAKVDEAFEETLQEAGGVYRRREDKIPVDDEWHKDGPSEEVRTMLERVRQW